jgi:hypothetical protein
MTGDGRQPTAGGPRTADDQHAADEATRGASSVVRLASSDDHPPPVPVSPHLSTWWFGLMALAGVGFGLYAEERPFGPGIIAHPLAVFFASVVAGLLTLRFLHGRPVLELIPRGYLAAGVVIGVACFFVGTWFGVSLMKMP